MRLEHNLAGQKFGKLTALTVVGYHGRSCVWHCKCDCGSGINFRRDVLVAGLRDSCGCSKGKRWRGNTTRPVIKVRPAEAPHSREFLQQRLFHRVLKRVWRIYAHNATDRGREFSLTWDQFVLLVAQPCYYCGAIDRRSLICTGGKHLHGRKSAELPPEDQFVSINGLDRKDSGRGYTVDNCVPCCKWCNYGKSTQHHDEFLARCKRIAERHP